MHKIAVIDMGTNTFHLLIVAVDKGKYEMVLDEKRGVGLGRGGINQYLITEEAMDRAMKALHEYKRLCEKEQVNKFLLSGTSAVRSALNKVVFLSRIKNELGWNTLVIEGEQEAAWIYEGVKASGVIPSNGSSLVVDIGGGSVEFILCKGQEMIWKHSFDIGGQRLMDQFQHSDPIQLQERSQIETYLSEQLIPLWDAVEIYGGVSVLIGSSGSFDSMCDVYCAQKNISLTKEAKGFSFPLADFLILSKELLTKDRVGRLAIPGMIELRVDMIVVALILIELLIERLQIQQLEVSFYSLKEGLLQLMLQDKL